MVNFTELSDEIEREVRKLHEDVLKGNVSLLNVQLVPIFNKLKVSLDITNLDQSSKTYIGACQLLDAKFKELKNLLTSLDEEKQYMEYLKSTPDDREVLELFENCWRKTFSLPTLSYSFLHSSKKRLDQPPSTPITIEHLEKEDIQGEFVIDVSNKRFSEEMLEFYEGIKNLLPCRFNQVFIGSKNQTEIYERFIYVLHLLQTKKIKYQKETNTLYL